MLRLRRQTGWVAITMAVTISGCQTTGDPNAGGLFGWSPAKARQRQTDLQQQAADSQQQAAAEQSKTQAIRTQRTQLSADVSKLRSEVDAATAENERLDARLRALIRARNLGATELDRLTRDLGDSERLRQSSRRDPNADAVNAVSRQNAELRRDIVFLSDR